MPASTTLRGSRSSHDDPTFEPGQSSVGGPVHPSHQAPTRLIFLGPLKTAAPNGSTVKNAILVESLIAQGVRVRVIDTGDATGSSRLTQLRSLLRDIVSYRQVLMSVSQNGFATLVPLLGILSVLLPGMRFAVIGMGSGMPREIAGKRGLTRRFFEWALKRATGIYVQGQWIVRELEALGFENASVLANLRPRPTARWSSASLESRSLVFISRVIPDKGVERAMLSVEKLRSDGHDVSLEVYGPVADSFSSRFDELLERCTGTTYHGVLEPERVPDVLASHTALVLPTTWAQEGMPGILVEAAMVGMPVIASDLEPIAEVVEKGVSGLLVDPHDMEQLTAAIRIILTEPAEAARLADALGQRAVRYDIDVVIDRLCGDLIASGWR